MEEKRYMCECIEKKIKQEMEEMNGERNMHLNTVEVQKNGSS